MRNFSNHIMWVGLVALMMHSCVSLKPTASSVTDADYNQRVKVNNPQYLKKHNALGWAFDIGAPIAGAVAGYFLDPFARQTDNGQTGAPAGGAVLGAVAGLGLTYASHAIIKYGSTTSADDKQKWVKKAYGSDYTILESSGSQLKIINNSAEKNFTVKDFSDVSDFAKAFPSSQYYEQVVAQSVEKLSRDDLPGVLELFPQTANAQKLKDRYINESPTYEQLISALQKFPKPATEVEELYVNLVRTPSDAVDFHQRYPNSSFNKKVVLNAFQTEPQASDVRKLTAAFGNAANLSQSDLSSASDLIRKNYYIGMRDMNSYSSMSQLDDFNEKYSWLTFEDKKHELAVKAWTLADQLYAKGTDVISHAGLVVGKSYARKVGLDGSYFNTFVNDMLQQQFDKISVASIKVLSSASEEFERWKKSIYSAGLVQPKGNLQFLVFGEVKNDSKFDIPISLDVCADLCRVVKLENGGLVGGVMNFLGKLAGVPMENTQTLCTVEAKGFIIPCALGGQSMPYAVLVEIGEKLVKSTTGVVNIADIFKASSQLIFQNPTVNVYKCDKEATQEQLEVQNAWLEMAKNGLPDAKFYDIFRNQEYKQSTWDKEFAEIMSMPSSSSYSSSSSSRRNDDSSDRNNDSHEKEETKSSPTKMYTCTVRLLHKDGSPINCNRIHAEWDEGGALFQNHGKGDFKVDNKGYANISWPADEGDRVNFISFNESILPDWVKLENLELKDGNFYELNVDALSK